MRATAIAWTGTDARIKPSNRLRLYLLRAALLLVCTALLAACATPVRAAEKHPFGIDDYSALRSAHAIAVSPDGKRILYDVSAVGTKGPAKHEWRLIDVTGENSRKLDLPDQFHPLGFTKDGALYGTYRVGDLGQLGIVSLESSKPTLIIALPNGVNAAAISPDGAHFALLSDPRPKDPLAGIHNVVENDETSLYVVGANGADGAWWCPDLKFITDIAWSKNSSQSRLSRRLPSSATTNSIPS